MCCSRQSFVEGNQIPERFLVRMLSLHQGREVASTPHPKCEVATASSGDRVIEAVEAPTLEVPQDKLCKLEVNCTASNSSRETKQVTLMQHNAAERSRTQKTRTRESPIRANVFESVHHKQLRPQELRTVEKSSEK